jgi:hypothetical protein
MRGNFIFGAQRLGQLRSNRHFDVDGSSCVLIQLQLNPNPIKTGMRKLQVIHGLF